MKLYTSRKLVQDVLGVEHLTQRQIDRAVRLLHLDGWVLSHHPTVEAEGRAVPAVRQRYDPAPLMRATYEASLSGRSPAWVAIAEVEEIVKHSLGSLEAGEVLGRHGLAIAEMHEEQVGLRGTSPSLAKIVNRSRLGREARGGWSSHRLVQAALGLSNPPARLTEGRLLGAAEVFEQFDIDASHLLEGGKRSHLYSKWCFKDILQPA